MALSARAPAKLNLSLYVGARRPDGLHEICSLFQSLTLADELRLEPAGGDEDEVVCPPVLGQNLAERALAAFRERFGWDGPPVRITIDKRIPIGAGLGGGSADAAGVLRLALEISGISPPAGQLIELAASLGADVPSQLDPGTSLVRGAGELVEPLTRPAELAILVLAPDRRLSTADVYARADELGLPERDLDSLCERLTAAVSDAALIPGALSSIVHNDLEAAAIDLEPAAGDALELLRASGARAAAVSGSGPAAFGLYDERRAAAEARAALRGRWEGEAIVAGTAGPRYAAPRPAVTTS